MKIKNLKDFEKKRLLDIQLALFQNLEDIQALAKKQQEILVGTSDYTELYKHRQPNGFLGLKGSNMHGDEQHYLFHNIGKEIQQIAVAFRENAIQWNSMIEILNGRDDET